MGSIHLRAHAKFAIYNLAILAFIGALLRYKIVFQLVWIDQKHLLHGHSHFAFTGWVTHALMLLIVYVLQEKLHQKGKHLNRLFTLNLICAYGMLISFAAQGYGVISITFSTLSIILGYWFAILIWPHTKSLKSTSAKILVRSALIFHSLSSIGAFTLAFMMATKTIHQNWYRAAVYFFLHFEYNGWFLLGLLGLYYEKILSHYRLPKTINKLPIILSLCVLPTYFLSTLWMSMPILVYFLVVFAAILQLLFWLKFIYFLRAIFSHLKNQTGAAIHTIFLLAGSALTIKLGLQAGSTIPQLSTWAFGFRPIVIGYLHLVLLGVISLSILAFLFHSELLQLSTKVKSGIIILVLGIIFNELLLLAQGVGAISMNVIAFSNELLILASLTMLIGASRIAKFG